MMRIATSNPVKERKLAGLGIILSKHGIDSMQTRGVSEKDVDFILQYGTQVKNGYLILRKDAMSVISDLKRDIARIERLASKQVLIIEKNNVLVTTYMVSKKRLRNELQHKNAH